MTYYRRRSLRWWEELAALGAGAAVGAAAVWLARTWLRREPVGPDPAGSSEESPSLAPPRGREVGRRGP